MKHSFIKSLAIGVLVIASLSSCESQPKYVFYMIGDGMGINEAVGTRLFNEAAGKGENTVNFLNFPVRTFVTTRCANSLVTDSSAAGTALATGTKVDYGVMGISPEGDTLRTVAERAKALGYGVGLVTNVGVNHATPAAFYAHSSSRNNYDEIAEQLIASSVDIAAGGGFNLEGRKGKKAADYIAEAQAAGIEVYVGKESFAGLDADGRVILLAENPENSETVYAINHTESDTQLADFTKAAIDHLYKNHKDGFFLMVEGGSIDHGGHDDDAATMCAEVNDFTESIDLALAFYNEHPKETVIIVTADHETGGLMLGAGKYEMKPERLLGQKVSESVLSDKIREMQNQEVVPTWDEVKAALGEYLGLWTVVEVSEQDEAEFAALYDQTFQKKNAGDVYSWYSSNAKLASFAVDILDKAAGYGYQFGSHSGSPVGLYAIGAGADAFLSCRDNTDIPKTIIEIAGY